MAIGKEIHFEISEISEHALYTQTRAQIALCCSISSGTGVVVAAGSISSSGSIIVQQRPEAIFRSLR